jgi:hypothetical protein
VKLQVALLAEAREQCDLEFHLVLSRALGLALPPVIERHGHTVLEERHEHFDAEALTYDYEVSVHVHEMALA